MIPRDAGALRYAEGCYVDTRFSVEERFMFALVQRTVQEDMHPNAHALRLKLAHTVLLSDNSLEGLMELQVEVTKYLAKLLDRHKVYPLASAGYNAGGGAVGKWRRQFGDVEVDEFVERIPYREAHLYAKSVTQTMARYLWLYEGQMLTLDLRPVGHPDQAAPPTE